MIENTININIEKESMKKKTVILECALLMIGLFTGCKQESNDQIDDLMDGIEFDISQHDIENIFLDKYDSNSRFGKMDNDKSVYLDNIYGITVDNYCGYKGVEANIISNFEDDSLESLIATITVDDENESDPQLLLKDILKKYSAEYGKYEEDDSGYIWNLDDVDITILDLTDKDKSESNDNDFNPMIAITMSKSYYN